MSDEDRVGALISGSTHEEVGMGQTEEEHGSKRVTVMVTAEGYEQLMKWSGSSGVKSSYFLSMALMVGGRVLAALQAAGVTVLFRGDRRQDGEDL